MCTKTQNKQNQNIVGNFLKTKQSSSELPESSWMLSRHLINLSIHVTKHKERAKSCHALKLKVMQMVSDTKHLFNLIYKLLRVSKVTKRLTAALCLALVDDHHSRLWRASHWQHISCRIQGQEAPCSD